MTSCWRARKSEPRNGNDVSLPFSAFQLPPKGRKLPSGGSSRFPVKVTVRVGASPAGRTTELEGTPTAEKRSSATHRMLSAPPGPGGVCQLHWVRSGRRRPPSECKDSTSVGHRLSERERGPKHIGFVLVCQKIPVLVLVLNSVFHPKWGNISLGGWSTRQFRVSLLLSSRICWYIYGQTGSVCKSSE